jgi:hypothetical protein
LTTDRRVPTVAIVRASASNLRPSMVPLSILEGRAGYKESESVRARAILAIGK